VPAELKDIKRRLVSTRQIRRVTGTLQRVAAARMARDRRAIENSGRYLQRLTLAFRAVGTVAPDAGHSLMTPPPAGDLCVAVFGPERGLCGGFTSGLIERLEVFVGEARAPVRLIVAGRLLDRRLRRAGFNVARFFPQPPVSYTAPAAEGPAAQETQAWRDVRRLTAFAQEGFLHGSFREVHVLCWRFVSALRQTLSLTRLLPAAFPGPLLDRFGTALIEPRAEKILAWLVPQYVERVMFDAFLNSLGAENAARQLAMSRATENADELLADLAIAYRRQRQDSITTEMLELFAGESGRAGAP
jgi:F-type H+-transporting ATPase subunit gamma